MSDTKNSPPPKAPHTAVHDTLGIVLIILGAFLGVAAVMFIRKGAPENPALPAALMISSVELLGPPTILWLCLGFVFVGGRLFLFGGEKNLLRDGLGFLFTGLGLSIVMGAFSPVQGGSIGNGVGGVVHPVIGVLLGGATVLAAAWVAWLRVAPPDLVARASALVGDGPGAETGGAPEARSGNRSAPRGKLPSEDPSGVTTAEADALLPDADRDEILAALRAANRNSASTVNRAPSPYPPDVRRDGGIPEGARPIEAPHEHKRPEPAPEPKAQHGAEPAPPSGAAANAAGGTRGAAAVHVWNAPKPAASPLAAGSDLAVDAHAGSPAGTQAAPAQGLSSHTAGTAATARPAPQASTTKPQRPSSPPQSRTALEMAHAVPIPSPAGSPTTPTWERDEELETPGVAAAPEAPSSVAPEEVRPPSDAEVVDAYGTPLKLVAELRGQSAGPQAREEDEPRTVARVEAEPALTDSEDMDEDAEFPGASADMEEDAEEESPAAPRVLVQSAEDQLQDSDSDEALGAPQGEDDARAVEALGLEADDDFSAADEDQAPFDDEPADHGDLPAPEVVAREEREVVLQPVQPSLFDAPAPVAPAAPVQPREAAESKQPPTPRTAETPASAPGVAEASSGPAPTPAPNRGPQHSQEAAPAPAKGRRESSGERQVTLTPIPAPPARSAVPSAEAPSALAASAPPAGREGEDLVYKSGMLFLKQNRVAVSMLQREFGMDFKQATAVLDELQAQGLIGPYLGGQRRDILLTAEEWRAKVGAPT